MKKILIVIFLLQIPFSVQAVSFSDVPKSHQYYESIKKLAKEKIVGGYEDQTYKPYKVINRAEFLKIVVGAKLQEEEIDENLNNCFSDVNDEWFAPFVCYAKENEWVGGYPDGTFRPANNINFGEAFAIIARIFELNVTEFNANEWYYPYQRYFDVFDLVGNIEQSIAFQVNRGEMANLVYQVREHLDDLNTAEIEAKIAEQKNMENLKIAVFHFVNEERKKRGVGELVYNIQLEKTAQMHAEDMVNRNFFAHVNPDGVDVMTRVKTYKYDQRDVGENIALGQENVEEVMNNWLNSPPHLENLLRSNFTEMGVGVFSNGEEGYSWVQVFGKPCEERDNMVGCTTRSDYQERNTEDEVEANRWKSPFTWY